MKRYRIFLGSLVFLLVLSTISFADWVCVEKIPGTKDYGIFQIGDTYKTEYCVHTPSGDYCCADMPMEGNVLKFYQTTTDNKVIEQVYRLLWKKEGPLTLVKAYTRYNSYITLSGPPGTYLVQEDIPKDSVRTADDIQTDGFILKYDPVIAWMASLGNEGRIVLHYTVRRGVVPDVLPTVRLAGCDLKVRSVSSDVLSKGGKSYLIYTFEVLLGGKRVIPPTSHTHIYVGGLSQTFQVDPGTKLLEVVAPLGEREGPIPVSVEITLGKCRAKLSDVVRVVRKEPPLLTLLGALLLLATGLFLWYRRRG